MSILNEAIVGGFVKETYRRDGDCSFLRLRSWRGLVAGSSWLRKSVMLWVKNVAHAASVIRIDRNDGSHHMKGQSAVECKKIHCDSRLALSREARSRREQPLLSGSDEEGEGPCGEGLGAGMLSLEGRTCDKEVRSEERGRRLSGATGGVRYISWLRSRSLET